MVDTEPDECSHFWRWSDEVAADTMAAGYVCDFCGVTR